MKEETIKTEFQIWLWNYILAPFSWSRWTDIATFSFGYNAYLLQGKVNKRTNAKRFRVQSTKQVFAVADIGGISMEQLDKCKLIDTVAKFNSETVKPTEGKEK